MIENVTQARPKHHPPVLRFKCRAEFINGEATLPQLHDKYRVPLATLKDWCFTGKWSASRERILSRQSGDEPPANPLPTQIQDLSALLPAHAREYASHLARLRLQLAGETEPNKIERLCAAIAKLEDVFQVYANIAKPGSRRPGKEVPKPESYEIEPL